MGASIYVLLASGAVLAILAGLAGALVAARLVRPGKAIRAESVDIVDRRGRTRARIAADENGRAGLFLLGASGEIRGELAVLEGAVPRLALFDGEGGVRASLVGDAAPALILLQKEGKRRVHLGLEVDGAPSLEFFAPDGRGRVEMMLGSGAKPSFLIRDERGVVRGAFGILGDGSPLLATCDERGKPIWIAPQLREAGPKQ